MKLSNREEYMYISHVYFCHLYEKLKNKMVTVDHELPNGETIKVVQVVKIPGTPLAAGPSRFDPSKTAGESTSNRRTVKTYDHLLGFPNALFIVY